MQLRFSKTPRFVKFLLPLILLLPLIAPVNFVLIYPGEGTPLFPKLLKVSNETTYPVDGQMLILSIWVTNPETDIFGYEVLKCWAISDCVVVPRSVVYPEETDNKAEFAVGKKQMKKSQGSAVLATRALFEKVHPEIDLSELGDSSVNISLKNTGGPSAGLIFALGLSELLAPENLLRGRKIAATGTISPTGKVGAIGGVEEKIIAAKRAGATVIFISPKNCDEVPATVEGVGVIAVSTLEEAYEVLAAPKISNFQGVRGCTNLRA